MLSRPGGFTSQPLQQHDAGEHMYTGRPRRPESRTAACSSSTWAEAVLASEGEVKYPPRADTTPMRECQCESRQCAGQFNPRAYGDRVRVFVRSRGRMRIRFWSEDCLCGAWEKYHRWLVEEGILDGPEPTRDWLAKTKAAGAGCDVDLKLAAVDDAALARQVARYNATGRIIIGFDDGSEYEVVRDSDGSSYERMLTPPTVPGTPVV